MAKMNLLTVKELARWLRVPVSWIKGQAAAGSIPAVQAGDDFLFDWPTVEQTLRARAARGEIMPTFAIRRGARRD